MIISEIFLRRIDLPLVVPYRLSYRTFETFEPIVVEVVSDDGRVGWGEGHISPGSSAETREGGWAFVNEFAPRFPGMAVADALDLVGGRWQESKVAATALTTALEMLNDDPRLAVETPAELPLLTPFNAMAAADIAAEVESRLEQGFRTFKIKVGKDAEADRTRVKTIQQAAAGRATLRLDANRAYSRAQALDFVSGLSPDGIELFEQPCDADDWDANAAVAAASPVPLMLDEPICTLADIERAAGIGGVGFCKLKLKRFGGLAALEEGLNAVRAHGMSPVLGDGLGSEIACWMEACVAARTIDNAGEFNGFLKPKLRLFTEPLDFRDGTLHLPAGYRPEVDRNVLQRQTLETVRYGMEGNQP